MAKIQLSGDEKLLGEAQASHVKTVMFFPQANPGKMYVTDRRVVFEPTQGKASSAFESTLEEIGSFSVGAASTITLKFKSGESPVPAGTGISYVRERRTPWDGDI